MLNPNRPQVRIWRMLIACWMTKATNTHSEYVILISFPLQQWLHERPPLFRYTYISGLVKVQLRHPKFLCPLSQCTSQEPISVVDFGCRVNRVNRLISSFLRKMCVFLLNFNINPQATNVIYIYMERIFLMFLDHTQRRTTVGRTPLDE